MVVTICRERMSRKSTRWTYECGREATHMTKFIGRWRPVCAYHRRYYSDLPMVPVERFDPAVYPNDR